MPVFLGPFHQMGLAGIECLTHVSHKREHQRVVSQHRNQNGDEEQTKRTIERILNEKTSASTLWKRCDEYVQSETKDSFTQFQDLFVEWDSIAVAFMFPAFSCPSRFPMVDTRNARYVAHEGSRLEFSTAPEIDKTLKRYRDTGSGVFTLRDWPFIVEWVGWCRKMADRLSVHKKHL